MTICFESEFGSPHTRFHPNLTKNTKYSLLVGLVGRAGRSKNGRRRFKLILLCFWSIISPHTKFHPNRTENTEVENFRYWSVLAGRAGRSKNGRIFFIYLFIWFQ